MKEMAFILLIMISTLWVVQVASFHFNSQSLIRGCTSHYASTSRKHWPGNRPPTTNPERLEQCMDANWGRGKYRTEVWEGNDNPVDWWWAAYTPSAEEEEAAEAGYDFDNPRKWHEDKGINYDEALEETLRLEVKQYEEFKLKREKMEKEFTEEKLEAMAAQFKLYMEDPSKVEDFDLDELVMMVRTKLRRQIREEDDRLQALKGQPSLDVDPDPKPWWEQMRERAASIFTSKKAGDGS